MKEIIKKRIQRRSFENVLNMQKFSLINFVIIKMVYKKKVQLVAKDIIDQVII